MINASVIYYTSNKEPSIFEKRIQETLIKNSNGLPIISISQMPMDLGKNICVGNVGASGFNMFRQMQIACQSAKTKYVISAEADCLYPPDYFTFIPPRDDICYRNCNTYIVPDHRDYFFRKKEGGTWVQIINREFFLSRLEALFIGAPKWCVEEINFPKERWRKSDIFDADKIVFYKTENACISFKTHRGMRYYSHSERIPIYELPYWGKSKEVRSYYMNGVKEVYSKEELYENN